MNDTPVESGYAPVNGMELYYESQGSGGTPVIVLHGGFGSTSSLAGLVSGLATSRRVITVDQQGHGRTKDIDREISSEAIGDDIGQLIGHLGLAEADVVGLSMGAGTALQCAIQHPDRVRRLVVIGKPMRRQGWYPEVQVAMSAMNRSAFEGLKQAPFYAEYLSKAPDPDHFPELIDKMGRSMATDYDWTEDVTAITARTMLIFGDADAVPLSHISDFYAALGGGQGDPGWDRANMSSARLSILPNCTHYELERRPELPYLIGPFLDEA